MLQEIETKIFTLTPQPVRQSKIFSNSANLKVMLCVCMSQARCGCSGVNFGMALDNNFRDVDTTFDSNGVKVVVDNVSIDYLREATIDFVTTPARRWLCSQQPERQEKVTNTPAKDAAAATARAAAVAVAMVAVPVPVITNFRAIKKRPN